MIDALRPWIGVGLGIALMINGLRWVRQPDAFVGVSLIPANDPRTVRILGAGSFIVGAANALVNLYPFLPE